MKHITQKHCHKLKKTTLMTNDFLCRLELHIGSCKAYNNLTMSVYVLVLSLSGFYAESPDDGEDERSCDGPCALRDYDVGEPPSICDVQRDHPAQVFSVVDEPPSGTRTATLDDRPLTTWSSSGGNASKTVRGRCRLLLLLLVLAASLPTRRCTVILLSIMLLFTINCLEHVRLIRCLPASFVNR